MTKVEEIREIVIIGAGPAGYTAAIYASRANLNPLLITGMQPGGQLTITTEVENYPGFPDGIQGPQLMTNFEEQAIGLGTEVRFGYVDKVDFSQRPFKIHVEENVVLAKTVIVCTGASAKWLGLENEQNISGISACATCDGFFFRGKEVAVVGGGDTACEEALYLSKMCDTVYLFVRGIQMRASKVMQDRVLSTPNIIVSFETEVIDTKTIDNKLSHIFLKNLGHTHMKEISALFIAIGHKPNTEVFKGVLELDEQGYIVTKPGTTKTSIEGVFAAGDVQDKIYRQAITAAGSGCMAALEAERFLNGISSS